MSFGNPFGLALYDKQQREVSSTPVAAVPPLSSGGDPSLAPLDPTTTRQLLGTLRALPRPALEGFTKEFRKRFQVPEEAVSIADRICQKRHHEWIEGWLLEHQGAPA